MKNKKQGKCYTDDFRKLVVDLYQFGQKVKDAEVTEFFHHEKENHPIQKIREILDIPRSTYYQSLNKMISNRERENNKLIQRLITIYQASKQRYSAPKRHHLLVNERYDVGVKLVQCIMEKAKIRSNNC